ncbi:MAG: thiopeptide-type bacteriocin biosynthesis protein [Bacteroidales bacterium]|jgi:thiopeptide-type bacteriocin biosynthesis protein|nr:thiopeptide-type bacteriocin biosynthesis protein [Bacteroidales bacterium]
MNIPRKFCLGSQWLYLKLYTGFKTADQLLKEIILPTTQQFKQRNLIAYWFFIRYTDPDFHLRIRMNLIDIQNIGIIITQLHQQLRPYCETDLVWKIQYDTYNREIERYGANTMEISEQIFGLDSEAIAQILTQLTDENSETQRWLIGLRLIDALLQDFRYDLEAKQALMKQLQESFGKEFNITDAFRRQFGQQYRTNRTAVEQVLTMSNNPENAESHLLSAVLQKSENLQPLINAIFQYQTENRLQIPLNDLLCSYIHMMLNRLFRTQQRKHELVTYDYLFRYYDALVKRKNYHEKLGQGAN